MRLALASGVYAAPAPGQPGKVCQNVYSERVETDPNRGRKLVRLPGTIALPDWAATARGYAQADGFAGGKILVVVGTALKTYDPATGTVGTITGTVAGTDRVQFAFTATQCGILGNGVLHVSDGSTVAATTDADYPTDITSIAAADQRLLFSYGSAGRWGYSDVLDIGATDALSYYTAEYSPDGLKAVSVLGATIVLNGGDSVEEWYPTGDEDNPYRRAAGRVTETGCLCRDSIRRLDNTLYWMDRECSVRRFGGATTPEIVSNADLARLARETDPDDIIAFAYERDGHAFYGVRLPTACYVFDANEGEWHTRVSNPTDTWRYGYVVSVGGEHFVGDAAGAGFARVSSGARSEHMPDANTMGTEIVSSFTGYAPVSGGVTDVGAIRLEIATGQGLQNGQGSDPVVEMALWNGRAFGPWRSRSVGRAGEYGRRVIWQRNGLARPPGLWAMWRLSDPVYSHVDGCVVGED